MGLEFYMKWENRERGDFLTQPGLGGIGKILCIITIYFTLEKAQRGLTCQGRDR